MVDLTTPIAAAQSLLWAFIASQEGQTLSLDPRDRGNWTSGQVGIGQLKGSKYGISAAAFPHIDIASVTYDQAQQICMTAYWPSIQGDWFAGAGSVGLAMALCDAAWGSGPQPAIMALQSALGITADGDLGPQTRAKVQSALAAAPLWNLSSGEACLIADYLAERVIFESQAGTWKDYEGGWVHRLSRIHALVSPLVRANTAALTA